MPRSRQTTQTGAPAQPISPVAHQEYGMGVQQAQLQQAMPAPQTPTTTVFPPAGSPATGNVAQPQAGPGGAAAAAGPPDMAQLVASMKGKVGLLRGGTNRPNEPITAGLSTGPGPGPEALNMRLGSPAARTLREISALTGDPLFEELARKARI